MQEPAVIMVAGPNGAGKSSIAPGLLRKALNVVEFVNADVIARGISGFNPDGAGLAAGRIMLERLDELAAERQSFAFETTAASKSFAARITSLKASGYYFLMAYLWVKSADISVERVARRVVLGGHNVPEETIRRRYLRGLINFFDLYLPLADEWRFYDNSSPGDATLVAKGTGAGQRTIHGAETWQFVNQMVAKARTQR